MDTVRYSSVLVVPCLTKRKVQQQQKKGRREELSEKLDLVFQASTKHVTPDMYALRRSYFFGSLINERKGTEGKATTKALGTL